MALFLVPSFHSWGPLAIPMDEEVDFCLHGNLNPHANVGGPFFVHTRRSQTPALAHLHCIALPARAAGFLSKVSLLWFFKCIIFWESSVAAKRDIFGGHVRTLAH
jgi:hypothetical protein